MPRFVTDSRPISAQHPITEFYRQEFLKHQRCLQQQRPYYSESAITDVEAALIRIMGQLETLCTQDNAEKVVSTLLKKFDVVTGLSAWSDPKHSHCRVLFPIYDTTSWPSSGAGSVRPAPAACSSARSRTGDGSPYRTRAPVPRTFVSSPRARRR